MPVLVCVARSMDRSRPTCSRSAYAACLCLLLTSAFLVTAHAHTAPQRQFSVKQLFKDAKRFIRLFYYHIIGPRLLRLRYKLTLTTYRLANTIWNVKLLWHYCKRPLVQGHEQLSRHFHPYIQQLAGRSLTTADTQLLAQALAVALPLAALLLLVCVLRAQRRQGRM